MADNSKRLTDLTDRSHLQPVIVFYRAERPWKLKNVGNGPALNVLVCGGNRQKEWVEESALLLPAIAPNEEIPIDWFTGKDKSGSYCAIYSDIADRKYTSECAGNRNTVVEGNKHPSLKPKHYQF